MKRKGIALLIGLLVVTFILAGCAAKTDNGATASDAATASPSASVSASADVSASPSESASPAASPSESPSPSPSVSIPPDGFVMGKVTAISGNQLTLSVVNPAGTKTITTDTNTSFAVSGSTKTATLSDIAVGDVISVTLSGTTALKIIDNGPDVNPDPSAYISPSPSPSADASPSAS